MDFLQRAGETVLNEIIGAHDIMRQSTRKTLEAWDQCQNFFAQILIVKIRFWQAGTRPCSITTVGLVRSCLQSVHTSYLHHSLGSLQFKVTAVPMHDAKGMVLI